jgi:hypothetical protein
LLKYDIAAFLAFVAALAAMVELSRLVFSATFYAP